VPESRAQAISDVRTDGVCEVFSPVAGCDAGGCFDPPDGEPRLKYLVIGSDHGACTVTVEFSDGVCSRSASESLDSTCASDGGM
jgi:hypothetical protein